MSFDLKVNQLPARTWNQLGMNGAVLKNIRIDAEGRFEAQIPEEICVDAEKGCCAKAPEETPERALRKDGVSSLPRCGADDELDRLLQSQKIPVHSLLVPPGAKIQKPARFRFSYCDDSHVFDRITVTAQEDSELTVVMDFSSPDAGDLPDGAAFPENGGPDSSLSDARSCGAASPLHAKAEEGFAGIRTKIRAGKNSRLRLVQIQRLGGGFTFYNDIDGFCDEGARLEIIQLVLGGQSTFLGCRAELAGAESFFKADVGYLVQKAERLDMNYAAFHEGKRTKSEIDAHGVLRDRAFKLFRGTIDFQTGASGSEGEEKEDVLLLDDGVVNQTIPLILCAEEDVQGNHGATIGNLDDELLFYLESRGIPKPDIYELMARARLESVCQKIPDGEARGLAQAYLEEKTSVRTAKPEASAEAAAPAAQHGVSGIKTDAEGGSTHEH